MRRRPPARQPAQRRQPVVPGGRRDPAWSAGPPAGAGGGRDQPRGALQATWPRQALIRSQVLGQVLQDCLEGSQGLASLLIFVQVLGQKCVSLR